MKYIKKYKYFESNFNLNKVQNLLEMDEFNKIMLKCCNNVDLVNDIPIMRSINSELEEDFYLVDHRKIERQSSNTSNYYTLIMDNSEKWKDFPKRKHSVVCSLNDSYMGNEYRVVPLNNYDKILKKYNINTFSEPKWGVCPKNDLWDSFNITLKELGFENGVDLGTINWACNDIYNKITLNSRLNNSDNCLEQKDYNKLKNQLSNITFDKIYGNLNEFFHNIKQDFFISNNIKMNEWSLYDMYEYILDPVKNGFKIETYNELMTYSFKAQNEVWTDTPVLYKVN